MSNQLLSGTHFEEEEISESRLFEQLLMISGFPLIQYLHHLCSEVYMFQINEIQLPISAMYCHWDIIICRCPYESLQYNFKFGMGTFPHSIELASSQQ